MSYLYFIRAGKRGNPIKIGIADDVDQRLDQLQTGNHCKLYLITKIKADSRQHAESMEKWMHHRFKRKNIRGEWFKGSLKLKQVFSSLDLAKNNVDWDSVKLQNGARISRL